MLQVGKEEGGARGEWAGVRAHVHTDVRTHVRTHVHTMPTATIWDCGAHGPWTRLCPRARRWRAWAS